ncbi:MAG: phosphoribosyl-AMP cyclohydrolase [Elusimicrobiota bacterium]
MKKFLKSVKFDKNGLVPAVIQDVRDGEILMVAYMNRESLKKTILEGVTWFYSRSRKKLWKKGETSGNLQKVKGIFVDCDADCLLIKVVQKGDCACHTGYRSCFFRKLSPRNCSLKTTGHRVKG